MDNDDKLTEGRRLARLPIDAPEWHGSKGEYNRMDCGRWLVTNERGCGRRQRAVWWLVEEVSVNAQGVVTVVDYSGPRDPAPAADDGETAQPQGGGPTEGDEDAG